MFPYAPTNVCVKDIGSRASMVLQNYYNFVEMTSNMIYIVAFDVGFKCPRKIHLNTQCPPPALCPPPMALHAQTLYRTAEVCRKIMALAFPLAELELVVRPNSSAYTCEVLGWTEGQ